MMHLTFSFPKHLASSKANSATAILRLSFKHSPAYENQNHGWSHSHLAVNPDFGIYVKLYIAQQRGDE